MPIQVNLVINYMYVSIDFIYMKLESPNNSNEKTISQSLKIQKENITCKDGFCTLPNQNKNPNMIENNVNLFDPI